MTEKPSPEFDAWLETLGEGWWDDAGDAGGILDSLQEAFEAGWAAREAKFKSVIDSVVHTIEDMHLLQDADLIESLRQMKAGEVSEPAPE